MRRTHLHQWWKVEKQQAIETAQGCNADDALSSIHVYTCMQLALPSSDY